MKVCRFQNMNKEETDTNVACKAEVSNFFLDTVKPFINKLNPDERKIAMDWSMKIMTIEEYSIVKQYLMLLTWMIIKGIFVPPFDKKLSEEKMPEIKNILMEYSIESIMERIVQNQEVQSKQDSSSSIDRVRDQLKKNFSYDGVRTSITTSNEGSCGPDETVTKSTTAPPKRRRCNDPLEWYMKESG